MSWSVYKAAAVKAYDEGNYFEAESKWQAAVSEAEQYGKNDGRYALSVDKLANIQFQLGKYEEALPTYELALSIREEAYSPTAKETATCLMNLATVLYYAGIYDQAEANLKRALEIHKANLPKDSIEMSKSVYQLALVYHRQKKYEQAEPYYKQALEIKNKAYGPDHIELVHLLKNYADLLTNTNREAIATQMQDFAKSIEAKNRK